MRVYIVFYNGKGSEPTYDFGQAEKLLDSDKCGPGAEIRSISKDSFNDPGCSFGWDYPTFKAVSRLDKERSS